ncbi:MAG: response regulator transcription factor [Acidobacteria bacterium]|nr:response regulator transcription factor [Acidobacteriota bacterium]
MTPRPTALIADDEPLLRESLRRMLGSVWPELEVVAEARNGREAIDLFDAKRPNVCFLDVQMPSRSGIDVAHHIGRRAHLVFVTAFDDYAVEAFARGALDYLVKPVERERLAETATRLKERLESARPAVNSEPLLRELAAQIENLRASATKAQPLLQWIRAQSGHTLRMIHVDDIDYLRSDSKYTIVAWRDGAEPREAVVRTPLKELAAQLDPERFAQVHRSIVVNLRSIRHVIRHDNETAEIRLKGRSETLPVSRSYVHLFRQM